MTSHSFNQAKVFYIQPKHTRARRLLSNIQRFPKSIKTALISTSFIRKEVFFLPRANKGTSHYINLIRYFIEYCKHALELASIFFFYISVGGNGGGRRVGEKAAPKKLCIFFPLFSHRRDETARDIDPPRVSFWLYIPTLDIFCALVRGMKFLV